MSWSTISAKFTSSRWFRYGSRYCSKPSDDETKLYLTRESKDCADFNGGFSKYVEIFLRGFLANPLTLLSSENSLIVPRSRYAHMLIVSERGGRLGGRIFFAVPSWNGLETGGKNPTLKIPHIAIENLQPKPEDRVDMQDNGDRVGVLFFGLYQYFVFISQSAA